MRKLNIIKLFCLFAVVAMVAGCDAFLTFELYSSDVQEMVSGKLKQLDVNATLEMEYSESNYEEMKTMIQTYFKGAQNFRTEKKDMSDIMKVDYKVPVILSTSSYSPAQDLIVMMVKRSEGGKGYELGIAFNNDLFKTMNEEAESKFFASVDMDDMG